MDVDEFWFLIERSARETDGKDARLEWLRNQLARRSAEDIVDFAEWLRLARKKVDTWLMWGAMRASFGYGSDDGFWYFQMWLVGLGREAFERVAHAPDDLVDLPVVQRLLVRRRDWVRLSDAEAMRVPMWTDDEWPEFECLDYVGDEAWEKATGRDSDELFEALRCRGHAPQASPEPDDEKWELDDPEESARRLPKINSYKAGLYRG
ncbi:DUF4240 domain-containing protein [Sphaerimonospora thailandensis]|uniref:DUF4240 domain-containing protein n=1 Tax=Sphaerimonospora thailandensis TaxID=795644 RepID=A0A8J3R9M2_9ACTN|nr:DUF4240 domain-containing protein [Sphaerimonospora thailandensis]GIH71677.1 hypothetical protein Mth01_39300 [Sphaerimonospora thailandensis]